MGKFTKEDEGKLFTLLTNTNYELSEGNYCFLLSGAFGSSEEETALCTVHTQPVYDNGTVRQYEPKHPTPFLYLGKRKVTIGDRTPENKTVRDFHVFLSQEKLYGVPDHMYHSSSDPIIFAAYREDWAPPTPPFRYQGLRYQDQDLRYEGHLYIRPVLIATKAIESTKADEKPIAQAPRRKSFWDRLLLAVAKKLLG
jgi:hypothetical protein